MKHSLTILNCIFKSGLISISLLLTSCSLPMVSEQDEKLVWEGIRNECPDCHDIEKPRVLFTKQPLYRDINKKEEVMSLYIPSKNIIILNEKADIRDYEHECRCACKDDDWDEYYHSWLPWETEIYLSFINSVLFIP